jgi:hypothetical protein
MTRAESIIEFAKKYDELREGEKDIFSKVLNKLLQVNYICAKKQNDYNDYSYIIGKRELFEQYLVVMDFELTIDTANQFAYIANDKYNQLKLNKLESIFLLAFRLLYQEHMDDIIITDTTEINLEEMHTLFQKINLNEGKRLTKDKFGPILRLLKNYNLIDFPGDTTFKDDSRIKLYPTILGACNMPSIQALAAKLDTYIQSDANYEGEENESTEEI